MSTNPQQIKTLSATKIQTTNYPGGSRRVYECSNPWITRGVTTQPSSYAECIENSAYGTKIDDIVTKLGGYPYWSGASVPSGVPTEIDSTLIGEQSPECTGIESSLGKSWKGCYWAASDSVFSCSCPEVGENYINYLKLRLNVATFWNTPVETPLKRREFLDYLQYYPHILMTVAGDFTLKPGQLIKIKVDSISGYSTDISKSILSDVYYIISVKHTILNSGVHETAMECVLAPK
jgi:hypothetical protein